MLRDASKRLIMAGFLSGNDKDKIQDDEKNTLKGDDLKKKLDELSEEDLENIADHHLVEVAGDQLERTPYPTPVNSYHLIYESYKRPLETYYFWSLNHLNDLGFSKVFKITDTFAASEQSAMYGSSAQRLGLAQDKVVNFMVTIGRLVKELFQIVREIRILKERLNWYDLLKSDDPGVRETAEIALKNIYVDLVEGGGQKAGSVYWLAAQLNYATLPEIFNKTNPRDFKELGKLKEKFDKDKTYPVTVRQAVIRKLSQFLNWRTENEKELRTRERHTVKYLNQHYQAIRMYLNWIKPYLRHISRLSQHEGYFNTADMVSAFEGSVMEVEVLGTQVVQKANKGDDPRACLLLTFKYRTSPTMSFQGKDYKQGPIHMGKIEVNWRAYSWTQKQIDSFVQMKEIEDLELLKGIDSSIKEAIEELGEELKKYLFEAQGRVFKKEEKKEEKKKSKKPSEFPSIFSIYDDMKNGLKTTFKPLTPSYTDLKGKLVPKSSEAWVKANKDSAKKGAVKKTAKSLCWTHYKNFKKKHGFATW